MSLYPGQSLVYAAILFIMEIRNLIYFNVLGFTMDQIPNEFNLQGGFRLLYQKEVLQYYEYHEQVMLERSLHFLKTFFSTIKEEMQNIDSTIS